MSPRYAPAYARAVSDRTTRGAVIVTAGAGTTLLGTFLPWLRSGSRDRSSYAIFDLVERLGFAPDGPVAWALRLWPLVPLVLVAMTVAGWAVVTRHLAWPIAVAISGVGVAWIAGTSIALVLAPDVGLFRIGVGPTVALVGVAVAGVGAAWLRPRGSAVSGGA